PAAAPAGRIGSGGKHRAIRTEDGGSDFPRWVVTKLTAGTVGDAAVRRGRMQIDDRASSSDPLFCGRRIDLGVGRRLYIHRQNRTVRQQRPSLFGIEILLT